VFDSQVFEAIEDSDSFEWVLVRADQVSWFVVEPDACVVLDGRVHAGLRLDLNHVLVGD